MNKLIIPFQRIFSITIIKFSDNKKFLSTNIIIFYNSINKNIFGQKYFINCPTIKFIKKPTKTFLKSSQNSFKN